MGLLEIKFQYNRRTLNIHVHVAAVARDSALVYPPRVHVIEGDALINTRAHIVGG